ncbi:hypothetical protein C2S53_000070 [Perilla frutescens var. hirtella]|uniref:Uncharacterized protein n=1 Tax=Perilla frutescens var. hirtella TaxID=608512 RepID=A0AAD4IW18_PERFH|nr:hypothetical protein C2S53_000070 [Perilla frutescens var. hirtella]
MLLLLMFLSAGLIKGEDDVATSPLHYLIHKVGAKNSRKLMGLDAAILDYDYAGPNVKHDPRGKKGTPKTP